MSLYERWQEAGSNFDDQGAYEAYWQAYFKKEKDVYEALLNAKQTLVKGTVADLAKTYDMTDLEFVGFIDGANTSLETEIDIAVLTEASEVELNFDYEKLLYNMHAAKADWLYELPAWDEIFDSAKRKDIRKAYMASKTVVREVKVGRNDPCTCGSGKKYKKCCGVNA